MNVLEQSVSLLLRFANAFLSGSVILTGTGIKNGLGVDHAPQTASDLYRGSVFLTYRARICARRTHADPVYKRECMGWPE